MKPVVEFSQLPAANIGHHLPLEPVRHNVGAFSHLTGGFASPEVFRAHRQSFENLPGMLPRHVAHPSFHANHPLMSGTDNFLHPTAHVHSKVHAIDHWRASDNALSAGTWSHGGANLLAGHGGTAHGPVPHALVSHPVLGVQGSTHAPPTNSAYMGTDAERVEVGTAEKPMVVPAPLPVARTRAPVVRHQSPAVVRHTSPAIAPSYTPGYPSGYHTPQMHWNQAVHTMHAAQALGAVGGRGLGHSASTPALLAPSTSVHQLHGHLNGLPSHVSVAAMHTVGGYRSPAQLTSLPGFARNAALHGVS